VFCTRERMSCVLERESVCVGVTERGGERVSEKERGREKEKREKF
jgi:hypothetical protein